MRVACLCGLWVWRALRTWTKQITVVRIVPVPVVPEPARIGWASGNRDCGGTRESSQIYCDDRDVSREAVILGLGVSASASAIDEADVTSPCL